MKTRSYFGAPKPGQSCNFENFDEVQKWLEDKTRKQGRMVGVAMVGITNKRCVCTQLGSDGTHMHYPPMHPHRHKIRLAVTSEEQSLDTELRCCDNHLAFYLEKGWKHVAKLCSNCVIAEASSDDMCEDCLDRLTTPTGAEAYRLKRLESGWCLNKDSVLGCTAYALTGTNYCIFCTNRNILTPADLEAKMGKRRLTDAPRARVRLIPSSARPCTLSPGCQGAMTASVHIAENDNTGPHLWWNCETCHVGQKAPRTKAIPSPELTADLLQDDELNMPGLPYGPEPINAEMAEIQAHVKAIMQEDSGE